MKRSICILLSATILAGCQASTQSRVMLDALQQDCMAGNPDACQAVPAQQAQVNAEANANTTALAVGLGALAIGGAAVGVAASDRGGYRGYNRGYYRR